MCESTSAASDYYKTVEAVREKEKDLAGAPTPDVAGEEYQDYGLCARSLTSQDDGSRTTVLIRTDYEEGALASILLTDGTNIYLSTRKILSRAHL